MRVHTLVRIDTLPLVEKPDEIRAFIPVRNEILRLPSTLEHYRKIGVNRFFVIDNGSTDGSQEFLLSQPDCHVFVTHNSFSESGCSVEWLNALLNEYGINHWCLTVDADEWFIYPGYERQPLAELAAYLERTGVQGIFAFLLDMYGASTVTQAISERGRSPLAACRYFDRQYAWHKRPQIPGLKPRGFPEYQVFGGPRLRMLFPRTNNYYYVKNYYYLIKIMWRALELLPLPLPYALHRPPTLTKIPFVRWLPGARYQNNHATTPIKLSEITGVLLHFKFLEDFVDRVKTEVSRKEHWDGASEYARYLARLKDRPSLSLHYPGSVEYEGSEQLIGLGLLKEDHGWMRIRAGADGEAAPRSSRIEAPP